MSPSRIKKAGLKLTSAYEAQGDGEMKAESRFDTKKAFVLSPSDVEKIWGLLEEADLDVEATLDCTDGISRKTKVMKDVLEYPNPSRAEIKSLRLSGYSSSISTYSTITLGGAHSTSLSFSLNGGVDKVSEMRIKLIDIVDGMKPWYDLFARFDLANVVIAFSMMWVVFFSFLSTGKPKAEIAPMQALYGTLAFVGVIILLGLVGWGFMRLRRKFFPIAVFEIGQGAKRHEVAEKFRWGVIMAFIVGIVGAIAFKPFA